jgi:hypothetical protein
MPLEMPWAVDTAIVWALGSAALAAATAKRTALRLNMVLFPDEKARRVVN